MSKEALNLAESALKGQIEAFIKRWGAEAFSNLAAEHMLESDIQTVKRQINTIYEILGGEEWEAQ